MMGFNLYITQARPNPTGKESPDKALTKQEQLLCEWVDIENTGDESITFSKIVLLHTVFDDQCYPAQTESFWTAGGSGLFQPGQTLRIHSGSHQFKHLMTVQDSAGADWHGYAERDDFVLNNRCGDRIVVTWIDMQEEPAQDEAYFAPDPPENAILRRSGNQLILINGKTDA